MDARSKNIAIAPDIYREILTRKGELQLQSGARVTTDDVFRAVFDKIGWRSRGKDFDLSKGASEARSRKRK